MSSLPEYMDVLYGMRALKARLLERDDRHPKFECEDLGCVTTYDCKYCVLRTMCNWNFSHRGEVTLPEQILWVSECITIIEEELSGMSKPPWITRQLDLGK